MVIVFGYNALSEHGFCHGYSETIPLFAFKQLVCYCLHLQICRLCSRRGNSIFYWYHSTQMFFHKRSTPAYWPLFYSLHLCGHSTMPYGICPSRTSWASVSRPAIKVFHIACRKQNLALFPPKAGGLRSVACCACSRF